MAAGELDFVEPTDQGSFRKERFEITAAEAAEVAELIRQTHAEIKSMAFWEEAKHTLEKKLLQGEELREEREFNV